MVIFLRSNEKARLQATICGSADGLSLWNHSVSIILIFALTYITSFLRVTGCPLFAAVSAQNVQSQTDQQSHINAEHFSLAGIAHKAFDAGFIDREDLLQKNH